MTDAGFFKGTTTDQDSRFTDKKKKLMKSMKFGDNLTKKIDTHKINVESIQPWIAKRITELLSYEDDIVYDYVYNQLSEQHPDPKDIQINLTGFLNSKNARIFVTELWDLLLSAMETPGGVPAVFLDAKKAELLKKQEDEEEFRLAMETKRVFAESVVDRKPSSGVPSLPRTDRQSNQTPQRSSPTSHHRRSRRRYSSSPDDERENRDQKLTSPSGRHSGRRQSSPTIAEQELDRRKEREHRGSRYRRSDVFRSDEDVASPEHHPQTFSPLPLDDRRFRRQRDYEWDDNRDHPRNSRKRRDNDYYEEEPKTRRHKRNASPDSLEDYRHQEPDKYFGHNDDDNRSLSKKHRRDDSIDSPKRRAEGPICVPSPPPNSHQKYLSPIITEEAPSPKSLPHRNSSMPRRAMDVDDVELPPSMTLKEPTKSRIVSRSPSLHSRHRPKDEDERKRPREDKRSRLNEFNEEDRNNRRRRQKEELNTREVTRSRRSRQYSPSPQPRQSSRRDARPISRRRDETPEGPQLPATMQSVVVQAIPVNKKLDKRTTRLASQSSTSSSSGSSSDDDSSEGSNDSGSSSEEDSSSYSSSESEHGAEKRRVESQKKITTNGRGSGTAIKKIEVLKVQSKKPNQPSRSSNSKQTVPEGPQLPPPPDDLPEGPELPPLATSAADLEWKEHHIVTSSTSSSSGSSSDDSSSDSGSSDSSSSSSKEIISKRNIDREKAAKRQRHSDSVSRSPVQHKKHPHRYKSPMHIVERNRKNSGEPRYRSQHHNFDHRSSHPRSNNTT